MEKHYRLIEAYAGEDIEDAIEKLSSYKNKGILAKCSFNGQVLYSDIDDLDSAYKKVTGKTKQEHDDYLNKLREEAKIREAEHEAKIPELTIEWVKKGKEILAEDMWKLWEEIVPIRLSDLYKGMELKCCLDIIKLIDEDKVEEAKQELNNQGHSGMSYGLVCSLISNLHEKGREFVRTVSR